MTERSYERELGQVHTEIRQLQSDVSEIKETQKELRDTLIGAKGSWKVLTIAATLIVSIFTGILVKVSEKWFGG